MEPLDERHAQKELTPLERLLEEGAAAVIRVEEDQLEGVVDALVEGMIKVIEITMSVPNAVEHVYKMSEKYGDEILLGVGSVRDVETAKRSMEAGAKFVVSPILHPGIVEATKAEDLIAIAGAFTPTEAFNATEAGADIVKIFPADVVGMKFFKAVLAPMPDLKLMPTGGVTLSNVPDWFNAGACAVGIGSALIDKRALSYGNFGFVERAARRLRNIIDFHREWYE